VQALKIGFTNQASDPGLCIAVELNTESARSLLEVINELLTSAQSGGFVIG
jgi:hypothetical protein